MSDSFATQLAWASFIGWAFRQPEMREQFAADTGVAVNLPANAFEAAIDDATGHMDAVLEKFVEWATRTHYGLDYAPESYRDALARKKSK